MIQPTNEQTAIITVSLLILATVATGVALYWTGGLMVPFVMALFLSYLISPIVDTLQLRLRFPRALAVLVSFLVLLGLSAGVVLLIAGSFQELALKRDLYYERLDLITSDVFHLPERAALAMGLEPSEVIPWHQYETATDAVVGAIQNLPYVNLLSDTASMLGSLVSDGFLVFIFSVYMVIGRNPTKPSTGLFAQIDDKIKRYIVAKVAISAGTGFLVWFMLWCIGLDLALAFGMMSFLLNFIPTFGSIFATLLPLPVALVQFDSWGPVLLVLLLPGLLQFMIGNVIEPLVMGESLNLHPVTVLLALIFWGLIWGTVGMILAVPMTAVITIVAERFQTTRPVAKLLSGGLD